MDVDGIAPGRDFRKVIDETLAQCDVRSECSSGLGSMCGTTQESAGWTTSLTSCGWRSPRPFAGTSPSSR